MARTLSFGERIAQAGERAIEQQRAASIERLKQNLEIEIAKFKRETAASDKRMFKKHQRVYEALRELVDLCTKNNLSGEAVEFATLLLIENQMAPIEEPK